MLLLPAVPAVPTVPPLLDPPLTALALPPVALVPELPPLFVVPAAAVPALPPPITGIGVGLELSDEHAATAAHALTIANAVIFRRERRARWPGLLSIE
jgi:hypothetical protein